MELPYQTKRDLVFIKAMRELEFKLNEVENENVKLRKKLKVSKENNKNLQKELMGELKERSNGNRRF